MLHKGKKITLLPLTPAEIVQSDRVRIENEKKERVLQSENLQVAKHIFSPRKEQVATSSRSDKIKLRGAVMLATKEDLDAITDDDPLCYALISTDALFLLADATISMPPAITNLLQEYEDVSPAQIPPGLPPIRGIEHQIDLIPGATLPNQASYKTNPEVTKEIQ